MDKNYKIAFVVPWYGEKIPGGAEMETRGIISHLNSSGDEVEVLTTCVKEFSSNWNTDYYRPGKYIVNGVTVRRFRVRKRNTDDFDLINAKLMKDLSVTEEEEQIYMREMINSPSLYQFIRERREGYDFFVFIPYMFGTTYYGILECQDKAVLIPCFHDESYIYLDIYKHAFNNCAGIVYLSLPEYKLANEVFHFDGQQMVIGGGVDTDFLGNGENFRAKFHINDPFILYAGRKDSGKNVDQLITYFCEYKKRTLNKRLKLILIGGGSITIPKDYQSDILDLGFVTTQDKYDAYAAALALCQPSPHESFSLVIMESWLSGRPVLVNEHCDVTKNFVTTVNGGLYFDNYWDFEGCIDYFINHDLECSIMGENGHRYVKENFDWNVIVRKYHAFFASLIRKRERSI